MGRKQRRELKRKIKKLVLPFVAIAFVATMAWSAFSDLNVHRLQELADKERAKRSAYIAECLYGINPESCKKEISWR